MLYWQRIVDEVVNKNITNSCEIVFNNDSGDSTSKPRHLQRHYLDKKGLYLTHREAGCMFYIIKGMTVKATAHELGLSPRTIEFYLKRIKQKMNCNNRAELINILLQKDFLNKVQDIKFSCYNS